jgi:hypothetical protein
MHILLIEDQISADAPILTILDQKGWSIVIRKVPSLQEGIEQIEANTDIFDLVVSDYHGSSNVLLSALVSLVGETPTIMFLDDEESVQALQAQFSTQPFLKCLLRKNLQINFSVILEAYKKQSALKDLSTADAEFVRVKPELLTEFTPIESDVYFRVADNKYCKLFRKGASFAPKDLDRLREAKKIEHFYLRKEDYLKLLDRHEQALGQLTASKNSTPEQLEKGTAVALEALQTLVEKVGFTPAAQKLAKMSAQATLKLLGSRPQLGQILGKLKLNQGKYITSHSLVLAQIASALASSIGWSSAPTYLKLSLAAFLHDLPLKNNDLAMCTSLAEAEAGGFTEDELKQYKLHPITAAEYAREFHEIPADVDTILSQHHERPDGSGFPRSLAPNRLSPLSCLFIIAHDLMHYSMGAGSDHPEQFFALNGAEYSGGPFKKIMRALQEGTKIDSKGL